MVDGQDYRIEQDSIGEMKIPADAYYGVNTARAVENFDIARRKIGVYPDFIVALAQVKQAACRANVEIGQLDPEIGKYIDAACQEIIDGKLHDQFVVGVIQGGAGTSSNMNANEVIANRALELAGHKKGEYQYISPNDHVNMAQSTNDAYPSSVKIGIVHSMQNLVAEYRLLQDAFLKKSVEFSHVLKVGRTQMQDAVPMTLGQEFHGWATTISEDIDRLIEVQKLVLELNLGGTAIGTGINAHPDYSAAVVPHLRKITGRDDIVGASDLIEATSDTGVFMSVSSVMKRAAMKLSKICNDLRLLSSGPQAGFNEINLPARQAGSSIMPGKVNPVIPEAVSQVAYVVAGNDVTVSMAVEAGQLQLNAFEPVMLHTLMQNSTWLRRALRTLRVNCVNGITANSERTESQVRANIGLVTALNPVIGYSAASKIAKRAQRTGESVADIAVEEGLLTREQVEELLQAEQLAGSIPTLGDRKLLTDEEVAEFERQIDSLDLVDLDRIDVA